MYKVIQLRDARTQGWFVALVIAEGRKWTKVVVYEYPIRVKKILNTESKNWKHLTRYDTPKGMKYAVKMIHAMAKEYYRNEKNIPKSLKKVYNDY